MMFFKKAMEEHELQPDPDVVKKNKLSKYFPKPPKDFKKIHDEEVKKRSPKFGLVIVSKDVDDPEFYKEMAKTLDKVNHELIGQEVLHFQIAPLSSNRFVIAYVYRKVEELYSNEVE